MRLADCFLSLLVALAARQSELMLPMFYFSCLLENQCCLFVFIVLVSLLISSRARTVLTRFCEIRFWLAVCSLSCFCCCLCSFVIHAQIEKCSQVIHDDRRTGSRAVLLVAPFGKALRHISPSGVTSRIVVCWSSREREPYDIRVCLHPV